MSVFYFMFNLPSSSCWCRKVIWEKNLIFSYMTHNIMLQHPPPSRSNTRLSTLMFAQRRPLDTDFLHDHLHMIITSFLVHNVLFFSWTYLVVFTVSCASSFYVEPFSFCRKISSCIGFKMWTFTSLTPHLGLWEFNEF